MIGNVTECIPVRKTADDVRRRSCFRLLGNLMHRSVFVRCIVLCDRTDQNTYDQTCNDSSAWHKCSQDHFTEDDREYNSNNVRNISTQFQRLRGSEPSFPRTQEYANNRRNYAHRGKDQRE